MRALVFLVLFSFSLSIGPACATEPASPKPADAAANAGQQPEGQPPKQTDEFVPISQLPAQDQLPAAPLLVIAYAFVWLVLFAYVVSVSRRLAKVQHEVERLESDIAKRT
jgi:CcmD family protein